MPALPTLPEFAALVGRPVHTDITHRLYNLIVGNMLSVKKAPLDAKPSRGAQIDLPECSPALPRPDGQQARDDDPATALRMYLRQQATGPALLTPFRPARNHFL